jgi:hypothetical protein
MSAQQELRFKQLKQRKDRLSYAVETLELQAKQRERQLRMSMAAPQQIYDDWVLFIFACLGQWCGNCTGYRKVSEQAFSVRDTPRGLL